MSSLASMPVEVARGFAQIATMAESVALIRALAEGRS